MSGVDFYKVNMTWCAFMCMCCVGVLGWVQGTFARSAVAWELPEGRAYEMVSPPYKAGYGVAPNQTAAAPDGESFAFVSTGAFAGAKSDFVEVPYIARRTTTGWVTASTNPPPADGRLPTGYDYTPDLSRQIMLASAQKGGDTFSQGTAALIFGDLRPSEISFAQAWPLPDGPATFPGEVTASGEFEAGVYKGGSADLSHAIFGAVFGGLRQITGLGGSEPREEAVAVVGQNDGPGGAILQVCPASPSPNAVELLGRLHAISNDGAEIFFGQQSCARSYVRVNGKTTLELAPAGTFQGASQDGSKAFATNGAGELLMDVIDREAGHEAITETVSISPGASASVVVSSDDGSHIYFTSPGVLAPPNAGGHSPQPGASNLYVYDSVKREATFIDVAAVVNNEFNTEYQAQTTPDGRFLAFATGAQLTPDDKDTSIDIYRYDAQAGRLVRVSTGENAYDSNGNDSAFGASIPGYFTGSVEVKATATWRLAKRAISDDGATIVFSSAAPLSPRASNGKLNVYAWHEGRVGMISTGLSQSNDEFPVVSQSGRDIFFLTSQSILPRDSDGLADVYDARIGGGFPEANVPAGGCSGDACQGPPSVPSLLGAPASATFSGLGNPVAPASKAAVGPNRKATPKCKFRYTRNRHGKCVKVKVKKRARKSARGVRRGHKASGRGKS